MVRAIIILFLLVGLSSCTQQLICPAYQSSFIYDKTAQREKFVYYNASTTQSKEILASTSNTITLPPRDSTWAKSDALRGPALPQVRRVKQDRYLLLPEKTYKQALKALRTVEMKPVYPKKQDSLDIASELDSAARSITDTLTAQSQATKAQPQEDSVYVITKTKEKYNMDQDAYMWYFRDILVLPDVRAAMMEESKVQKAKSKSSPKSKKEGFFSKLFKKKKKTDSTVQVSPADSTSAKPPKKGLSGLFKKKSKVSESETQKKTDPAKKKEEEDGF